MKIDSDKPLECKGGKMSRDLNEAIQNAYEESIVKPLVERKARKRFGAKWPKWMTLKKRIAGWKKAKGKKPKKTKNAFDAKLWKKKTKRGSIKDIFKKMMKKIGIKEERLDYSDRILALAEYLDIDPEEVEQNSWGGYAAEGGEYEVLTDDEADDMVKQYIQDSVWAFNSWFLESHMSMENVNNYFGFETTYYDEDEDEEVEIGDEDEVFYMHMGQSFTEWLEEQQQGAENANDTFYNLIDDFDSFVDDAVRADGRGHFLSGYDGEEGEEQVNGTWYYIYRTN